MQFKVWRNIASPQAKYSSAYCYWTASFLSISFNNQQTLSISVSTSTDGPMICVQSFNVSKLDNNTKRPL